MGARQKLMQISNQFRREISVLSEGERKVRDMVSETEAAISTLEGQLVQCETANADAVANDDFARAEELSNQADAIRAQIEGKNSEIMQCMQRNGQAMQLRVNRVQTDLVSIDAMIASFAAAYNHVNVCFSVISPFPFCIKPIHLILFIHRLSSSPTPSSWTTRLPLMMPVWPE